jgi:hypothetical protein
MNTRCGFKITFTQVGRKRTKYNVSKVLPFPDTVRDKVYYSKGEAGSHVEVRRCFKDEFDAKAARSQEVFAGEIEASSQDERKEMLDICLKWLRAFGLSHSAVQRLLGEKPPRGRDRMGGNAHIDHARREEREVDARMLARIMVLCSELVNVKRKINNLLPCGVTSIKNLADVMDSPTDVSFAYGMEAMRSLLGVRSPDNAAASGDNAGREPYTLRDHLAFIHQLELDRRGTKMFAEPDDADPTP